MIVELSARVLTFPRTCPCCGNAADNLIAVRASRTTGKRVHHVAATSWTFPYCSPCLDHVRIWNSRFVGFWLSHGVVLTIVLVGWISGIGGDVLSPVFFGGNAAALVLALLFWNGRRKRAFKACTERCRCPGVSVAYLGWSGHVQVFDITSEDFADDFMRSNEEKLVNASADTRAALRTFATPIPSRLKGKAERKGEGRKPRDEKAAAEYDTKEESKGDERERKRAPRRSK